MREAQLYTIDFRLMGETPVWQRRGRGRFLEATPLLFGRGRVLIEAGGDVDVWEFPTWSQALTALLTWNGEGEPIGWDRHPRSKRYRPGGVARPAGARDSAPPVGRSA